MSPTKIHDLIFVALFGLAVFVVETASNFSCFAEDSSARFVESPDAKGSTIYDLNTLQLIIPGRFTVLATNIDRPEVMQLELAAVQTLYNFCAKPDGSYAAPQELLMLGAPDMAVLPITVRSRPVDEFGKSFIFKQAIWGLPYSRLALGKEEYPSFFDCSGPQVKSQDDELREARAVILNGTRQKYLFDCRRALMGFFVDVDDDESKAIVTAVHGGFVRDYLAVCEKAGITDPYLQ